MVRRLTRAMTRTVNYLSSLLDSWLRLRWTHLRLVSDESIFGDLKVLTRLFHTMFFYARRTNVVRRSNDMECSCLGG